MAINFATETLKTIISKGANSTASDVTTSDSAVAKFKAQDTQTLTQTQATDGQGTHTQDIEHTQQGGGTDGSHTASDTTPGSTPASTAAPAFPSLPNGALSDSAITELKAAYSEVKTALGDAGSDLMAHGSDAHGTGSGQGGSPLVKALTAATGEDAGAVREVLQQVHAVLRQEHTAQSGDQTNSTGTFWHDRLAQQDHAATDTTTATKTTAGAGAETGSTTQAAAGTDAKASVGPATDTASTDAKAGTAKDDTGKDDNAGHKMADGHLWHDRLAQQDGATSAAHGPQGSGTSATSDGTAAEWHHLVTQGDHPAGVNHGATAPALTTELTSAVDHFVQTLDDLHLAQAHGHAAEQGAQTAT